MANSEENMRFVLRKMLYHEYIGGKHTDIENLPKGRPTSEHGEVMEATETLVRYGWILKKKVPYGSGTHVSLNPRAISEVRAFLTES